MENTRRTQTTKSTKWGSHELTKTEAKGLYQVLCAYIVAVRMMDCGTPNSENSMPLTLLPALGTFFLLLGCLVQP